MHLFWPSICRYKGRPDVLYANPLVETPCKVSELGGRRGDAALYTQFGACGIVGVEHGIWAELPACIRARGSPTACCGPAARPTCACLT